jgi:hypothetical protein
VKICRALGRNNGHASTLQQSRDFSLLRPAKERSCPQPPENRGNDGSRLGVGRLNEQVER